MMKGFMFPTTTLHFVTSMRSFDNNPRLVTARLLTREL